MSGKRAYVNAVFKWVIVGGRGFFVGRIGVGYRIMSSFSLFLFLVMPSLSFHLGVMGNHFVLKVQKM